MAQSDSTSQTTNPEWEWERFDNPERWLIACGARGAFVRVHGPNSVDIDGNLNAATLREVLRKMAELGQSE